MENKAVLITGAAKRVGKDIALSMAKNGWSVAIHYNSSSEEAGALLHEIQELGVKSIGIKADLSDESQIKHIIEDANAAIGSITCLINNASVFSNDKIDNISMDSFNMHMGVNLYAPLSISQFFVEQLDGKPGNIINMLDYCVWNLPDKFLSYAISKYALWGATQMLAKQLAPKVRVNAIGPGHTLPNSRETTASFTKARTMTPLKNGADPEEISAAIDFILNSPSMTGQMLALDGGKHLIGADYY